MPNSEQYKPGQRITSMSRARFLQLWQWALDGTLKERWPKGKEAVTRKERTEAMQLRVIAYLCQHQQEGIDLLLEDETWYELEIIQGQGDLIHARAWRKRRRRRR